MRLRLRTADAGGELEVVAGIDEIVEGVAAVQMDFKEPGQPRTMVTIALLPEDVLVDEEAAQTREMKLVQAQDDAPTIPMPIVRSAGGAVEEVHEHEIPPSSFGGSE